MKIFTLRRDPSFELQAVRLPGSKSITNRALLLAALADGESQISGALKSDDTKWMAAALRQLGVAVDEPDATTFVVRGRGGKLNEPTEEIFVGNAGTAMRFLTAAATLVVGETKLTGDEWMQRRPIGDLADALRQLGVTIETTDDCPPLQIVSTGKLTGSEVKIRGNISSQFVSAVLMILPLAAEEIRLSLDGELASPGYVAITTAVMSAFSVTPLARANEYREFRVPKKNYSAADFAVEPDASSATYFWAAEKLLDRKIEIPNAPKSWIQPDADSREVMQKFPDGFGVVDGTHFPDAIPTLAVLAAFASGTTRFVGIRNLRVKECDRLTACATELNKIKPGIAIEEGDELVIFGDKNLAETGTPALISTYDDHRIAMAFALAGLKIDGLQIANPDCVSKSFPNFWNEFKKLGVEISE